MPVLASLASKAHAVITFQTLSLVRFLLMQWLFEVNVTKNAASLPRIGRRPWWFRQGRVAWQPKAENDGRSYGNPTKTYLWTCL